MRELLSNIQNGFRLSTPNLNDYITFTVGYANSATNKPSGVNNGYFEVIPGRGIVLQRYTPYNSNVVYTRQKTDDGWSEWKQI